MCCNIVVAVKKIQNWTFFWNGQTQGHTTKNKTFQNLGSDIRFPSSENIINGCFIQTKMSSLRKMFEYNTKIHTKGILTFEINLT